SACVEVLQGNVSSENEKTGTDFFFSSRRRHTRFSRDWSSDVCSSNLVEFLRLVFTPLQEFNRQLLEGAIEFFRSGDHFAGGSNRSEERRVGKERRKRKVQRR